VRGFKLEILQVEAEKEEKIVKDYRFEMILVFVEKIFW
jgi:hypothetical protein